MSNYPELSDGFTRHLMERHAALCESVREDTAYAQRLAEHIAKTHFPDIDFKVFDNLNLVLSQIDNMIVAWKPSPIRQFYRQLRCLLSIKHSR